MKRPAPFARLFRELRVLVAPFAVPIVEKMVAERRDPFRVLVATLLSLRTKDQVTAAASERLFARAATPAGLLDVPEAEVARLIYPVGFYKTKARTVHAVCRELLERHGSVVPDAMDALLALPGVGRKTANLVLAAGFGQAAVCVDTHVHRITNRWGFVCTRDPHETEDAVRAQLPRRYWSELNQVLVALGQNLCGPASPWCSRCTLGSWWCRRVGVLRSR